jgi:hypothetical protein
MVCNARKTNKQHDTVTVPQRNNYQLKGNCTYTATKLVFLSSTSTKRAIFVYDIYEVRLKYYLFYMTDSKFELFKYYELEQIREDGPGETSSMNGRVM